MLLLSEITESLKNNYTISLNEENKITQKNSNIDFAEDSKESKKLSKKINVFFIDELHIFNIVDALIVKKLFTLFDKYKIFVLVSSNFHPQNLYANGLQRSDFIPFIDLILNNFELIKLNNLIDYRRLALNHLKTYFTPINNETKEEFNKLFERFVDRSLLNSQKIKTKSREIIFDNCSANVSLSSFESLCAVNLAHEDYQNIASRFSLLFIENIPEFTDELADQCRRFISLIDMLYEQNYSAVLLAVAPITSLCKINKLIREFERTASRLYEMTIIKPS